ncbi:MAG: hypothetical protein A2234_06210 [Elusimicrobia bacterium RIFOXYA2_FULL_58_8]|nr:MAG: hypothetical protein A2234_06210 [Elusimicrobia bacterium RIFOXYA2_FULL_58_8]
MACGLSFAEDETEIRGIVEDLTAEKDERFKAAGFFLAAMSGFSDLTRELDRVLAVGPSPYIKLHAACALSRLGGAAGHSYLFSVASSGDESGLEALACLAYSLSPEAQPFLENAASGKMGVKAAAAAKIALNFRKQLAIIN